MRQRKSVIPTFEFYDRSGIQKYLEKQARKGWILEKLGKTIWKFRRVEPREVHYAVVYFPDADLFDPAPGEEEETFREFCAHGGWTLAGANAQMQIFWSDRENPTPIETDPALEVENIHRAMKKGSLPGNGLLILCGLLQLWLQGMAIRNNLFQYLSSSMNLFLAASWITLLIMLVYHLANYFRWYTKAKAAAREQNMFLETKSRTGLSNILAVLLVLGFYAMVLTMKDKAMALTLIISVSAVYGIMALTELVRKKMQKNGWDARTNRKTTLITTVVLVMILHFILNPVVLRNMKDGREAGREDTLAVTIWELLGGEAEDYGVFYLTDQESMLMQYQRIHQFPEGSSETNLQYELVNVKMTFLYEFCLERMIGGPVYIENGAYREIDPSPWGADRVWQLYVGEDPREWYVLCYEDAILKIIPTWEFTQEQIAAIAGAMR